MSVSKPGGTTAVADAEWGWRDSLACPHCHGSLEWGRAAVVCDACSASFPVEDGIPVFATERSAHSERQAEFFDAVDAEFEIARPHGTTRLYRWLIDEKFRRSVSALSGTIRGGTALSVCGGSGMEAEFLARGGARVVVADISLGAARRARERARRSRLPIVAVVADAEALPVADESFDLAYVHDGLHHLERPQQAVAEMLRVARRAVSINEPARAAATLLAVRLGLSEVEEEAGNRVERFVPATIAAWVREGGFDPVVVQRYAMLYRHEPGRASHFLSSPAVFELTRAAINVFNSVAGRAGNKLTIQAVRRTGHAG